MLGGIGLGKSSLDREVGVSVRLGPVCVVCVGGWGWRCGYVCEGRVEGGKQLAPVSPGSMSGLRKFGEGTCLAGLRGWGGVGTDGSGLGDYMYNV